ncbi:hypothetical protein B9T18_08875 [Wohlfahrtiimonas chitiniclastica]|nr:hypothetical protein B9T18_08875 [Wohlfahrtiimonas chitiniclastica]
MGRKNMVKQIYCITDGKMGHQRQTEGLATALQMLVPANITWLPAFSLWQCLLSGGKCASSIDKNAIVIGAGHRTHFALLYYRLRYHAKSIVIMKPSLPKSWFDHCIVPRHDHVTGQNVLVTEGAMNVLSLQTVDKIPQTVILIGGPSEHCAWCNEDIYQQLIDWVKTTNGRMILSTSRRTPADFLNKMPDALKAAIECHDVANLPSDWLPKTLLESQHAWVTADSVSMVFEALSADCDTKVIAVAGLTGKMAENLQQLPHLMSTRLNESGRVAQQLLAMGLFE